MACAYVARGDNDCSVPVNTLVIYGLSRFSIRVPKRPCRAAKCSPIRKPDPSPTSFPGHLHSSVLGPGPSVAFPSGPSVASSICSVPPSGPHLLHRGCLSSFSRYVQEIRAPSSGSSPLLPPPAAAAQSAATLTIYHGDGSLSRASRCWEISQSIYVIVRTQGIIVLSRVSSMQLQGSRC